MSAAIQSFITNPAYHDAFSLLKGARNGLVYGAKVRFPHALVIAILFGRGECVDCLACAQPNLTDLCSWKSRAQTIFHQTRVHAINLMEYVTLYKVMMLAQKKINNGKEQPWDTFFAGLIGAYVVFGDRNPVNEQVDFVRLLAVLF
jgi:peroxisomal membrane protein 4